MYWLALAVLAAAAAIAWAVVRRRADEGPAPDWSVQARRLLTPGEQLVFDRLREAFPQQTVLAQVAFERLLGMRRSHGSPAVFRRYARLVADCVICSRDLMPLVVVELKNAPHGLSLRTRAEASKSEVLAAAGLVYVSVDVASQPDAPALRAMIRAALPRRAPGAAPAPHARTSGAPVARAPAANTRTTNAAARTPAADTRAADAPAAHTPAADAPAADAPATTGTAGGPAPVRRIARTSPPSAPSPAAPPRPSRVA